MFFKKLEPILLFSLSEFFKSNVDGLCFVRTYSQLLFWGSLLQLHNITVYLTSCRIVPSLVFGTFLENKRRNKLPYFVKFIVASIRLVFCFYPFGGQCYLQHFLRISPSLQYNSQCLVYDTLC